MSEEELDAFRELAGRYRASGAEWAADLNYQDLVNFINAMLAKREAKS